MCLNISQVHFVKDVWQLFIQPPISCIRLVLCVWFYGSGPV